MSTIGGLSTSTSSNIRGYGGLASGLDRDSLIEGMTYGTTSKINQQKQKKTQLEWKQTAIRNISDMMIAFAGRYTESLTSPTNLFSSLFWGRNKITPLGANSNKVSITGTASGADAITIMGVKQLAKTAKWTSSEAVSNQSIETGKVGQTLDPKGMDGDQYIVQELVGKTLNFKYNDKDYSIKLALENSEGKLYDYSSAEEIAKSIQTQLDNVSLEDKTKLGDHIKVSSDNANGIKFELATDDSGSAQITGGSATEWLGLKKEVNDDGTENEKTVWDINSGKAQGVVDPTKLTRNIDFAEKVAGKEITFSYNGTTKTFKMPEASALNGTTDKLEVIRKSLQDQMDKEFGKGRISVGTTKDGGLSFKTYDPSKVVYKDGKIDESASTAALDKTSTLTLVSGDPDLVGANGALGIRAGATNRVDMNAKLLDGAGTKFTINATDYEYETDGQIKTDENGKEIFNKSIIINGETFTINQNTTMASLMKEINENEKAGVSISYQTVGDKFTFTSTQNGASGSVDISGDADFLKSVFGASSEDIDASGHVSVQGQDAVIAVKYAGSDEAVELIRDSNTFNVDGLTVNVKGTFGYKNTAAEDADPVWELDKTSEPVEINAQVDTDKIVDSIKSMVEEYNKIVDLVNKELRTKPNRDYAPLTSEQRKELDDDEIKLWEEKAKEGLLFGDSDLRSLSTDLRFVISGGLSEKFREIGITTSTLYSDNGKISIDETKLRAALETDPENVEKLFTSKAGTDADGNPTFDGLATNLRNVMDKYVKTIGSMETKGILIKKAGSTSSPMSVTENTIYSQLQEIEKMIARLQDRLESERDRYIKQFTSLETVISQMNSQSGFLSQFGGY